MVMDVVGIVLLVAAIGVVIFALAYQVRARRDNDRDR